MENKSLTCHTTSERRLIDAYEALLRNDTMRNRSDVFRSYAKVVIDGTPTVDAVPVVHGRWIGETGGYMWRQNCSICNGPVYNKMKPYYNYCPYCGALMDGGNEDG